MGFEYILGYRSSPVFVLFSDSFAFIKGLIPVVTSFTVAHSITLISASFGVAPNALWFPPLIETLIALSIVYMAFENIVGAKLGHRWMVTFGFGLSMDLAFHFYLVKQLQEDIYFPHCWRSTSVSR